MILSSIALLQWLICRCSFSCSRLWAAQVAHPPPHLLPLGQNRPLGAALPSTGPSTCLIAPGSATQHSWGSLGNCPQHFPLQLLQRLLLHEAGQLPSLLSGLPDHRKLLPHQRSSPQAPRAGPRELLLQGRLKGSPKASLRGSLKGKEVRQPISRSMQLGGAAME